jgi:chorismate mutase / prephenate dehydratase
MQEIEKLRAEIDQIHLEMVQLFRRRLQVARKIWEIKKSTGKPMLDVARETQIAHRFDSEILDPIEQQATQRFLRQILMQSRQYLEAKLK